jgi:hypothetical protein
LQLDKYIEPSTTEEKVVYGHFLAYCFNSPFSVTRRSPKRKINCMYDLGYLFFGPLTYKYLMELVQVANEKHWDKILFVARDGYIVKKLYDKYIKSKVEGVYLLTSRRSAAVCSIKSEKDIEDVFNVFYVPKDIALGQFLVSVFGINSSPEDSSLKLLHFTRKSLLEYILGSYSGVILENAAYERSEYVQYLERTGLKSTDTLGAVNFVGSGVTQYFLNRIFTGNPSHFFYFATTIDMHNIEIDREKVSSLYGNYLSQFTSNNPLVKHYLMAEAIFSAPQEQFVRFYKGKPEFLNRHRFFLPIEECHRGIEAFVADMMSLDISYGQLRCDFILSLFGLLFNETVFDVCRTVKDNFQISDPFIDHALENLW